MRSVYCLTVDFPDYRGDNCHLVLLQSCLAITVAAVEGIRQHLLGQHALLRQLFQGRQEGIGIMLVGGFRHHPLLGR